MLPKSNKSKKVHTEVVANPAYEQLEARTQELLEQGKKVKQMAYESLLESSKMQVQELQRQLDAERQKVQSLQMEQALKLDHIKGLQSQLQGKETNKEAKEAQFLEAFEVELLTRLTPLSKELETLPKDKYGNTIVQFEWDSNLYILLNTIRNIFDLVKIVNRGIIYNDYYNDKEKENIIIGISDIMSIVLPTYNRYNNNEAITYLTEAKEKAMQLVEQQAV